MVWMSGTTRFEAFAKGKFLIFDLGTASYQRHQVWMSWNRGW
jgi:hypothetical protein